MRRRRLSPLVPYTTLFRSGRLPAAARSSAQSWAVDFQSDFPKRPGRRAESLRDSPPLPPLSPDLPWRNLRDSASIPPLRLRSEEHTSELQSRRDLVCRLLL